MATPPSTDDGLIAAVRDLLVQLGVAMSAAGDSVDAIDSTMRSIVAAYGVEHVEVAVLPTSLMVSTGLGTSTQIQIGVPQGRPLRFDQVAELYSVVRLASSASVSPGEALDRLHAVYRMPPTFRWPVRTLGHAVLTVGLALLLQPTLGAVGAAFVLGLLVGLLKLPGLATLEMVFPVVVSFVVAVIVFATLQHVEIDNPVRILVPPLVTFLPGGALTIATVELAAGQMVSGASRLVNGLVQLLLLAFGILAASALFDVPGSGARGQPRQPARAVGTMARRRRVRPRQLPAPVVAGPLAPVDPADHAHRVRRPGGRCRPVRWVAEWVLRRLRDDPAGAVGGDPERTVHRSSSRSSPASGSSCLARPVYSASPSC